MIFNKSAFGAIAACLVGMAATVTLRAELPSMKETKWLGYFLGFENKKYQFTVAAQDGKGAVKIIGKTGTPLSNKLAIYVNFLVEEVSPDGKATVKRIEMESLESAHPASNKIALAVIRGKVKGDATFEVFVNEERGVISLGGRIVDAGSLKSPLRFSIRLKFQDSYIYDVLDDKKKIKAFETKTKDDKLLLIWTDKKRVKPSLFEDVDANSSELNGPGIAAVQLQMSAYLNNEFELVASENSSMRISNEGSGPLHKGFTLTWSADPAKDPGNEARLLIDVK